jgi:phosphatidylserine/phosphatidylglycerophosphate/cardiolipin synthase-like enzyme
MNKFEAASAARLAERDYLDVVLAFVESARVRIYASLFLFDIRPVRDVRGNVLELAMALIERRKQGVDVRVLLTGYVRTPELGVANVTTGIFLESYGVPHRRLFGVDTKRMGIHAKFALLDDFAVVGSQNWTDDGFSKNAEDAVILQGPAVGLLEAEFIHLWTLGLGLPINDYT